MSSFCQEVDLESTADNIGYFWSLNKRMLIFFGLFVLYVMQIAVFVTSKLNDIDGTTGRDANDNSNGESLQSVGLSRSLISFFLTVYSIALISTLVFLIVLVLYSVRLEEYVLFFDSFIVSLNLSWIFVSIRFNSYNKIMISIHVVITIFLITIDICDQRLRYSLSKTFKVPFKGSASLSGDGDRDRVPQLEMYGNLQSFETAIPSTDNNSDIDIEAGGIEGSLNFNSSNNSNINSNNVNNNNNNNNDDLVNVDINSVGRVNHVKVVQQHKFVFDSFRVRLDSLAFGIRPPYDNVSWSEFSAIEHRVDSSSCHIYTALWKNSQAVIIKLIKADHLTSLVSLAEFEMEARILSNVRHPNIVNLLGIGSSPRKFLVLELLEGGSLSHTLGLRPDANRRVTSRKFSFLEVMSMAKAIASAMNYLHNQWDPDVNIMHRDLKPDNIGWTSDGTLKIFDFGLCACVKAQRDKSDQYKLTGNTGTLRYMAPEVARGRSYNKTVDVYSFSMIIWQVLKGSIPFKDLSKKLYMERVALGGMRPSIPKSWPEHLQLLLSKCWHEDKTKRPDFSDILKDLDVIIKVYQEKEMIGFNYWKNTIAVEIQRLFAWIIWARYFLAIFNFLLLILGIVLIESNQSMSFTAESRKNPQLFDGNETIGVILVIFSSFFCYLLVAAICRGTSKKLQNTPNNIILGLELASNYRNSNTDGAKNINSKKPTTSATSPNPNRTTGQAPLPVDKPPFSGGVNKPSSSVGSSTPTKTAGLSNAANVNEVTFSPFLDKSKVLGTASNNNGGN